MTKTKIHAKLDDAISSLTLARQKFQTNADPIKLGEQLQTISNEIETLANQAFTYPFPRWPQCPLCDRPVESWHCHHNHNKQLQFELQCHGLTRSLVVTRAEIQSIDNPHSPEPPDVAIAEAILAKLDRVFNDDPAPPSSSQRPTVNSQRT